MCVTVMVVTVAGGASVVSTPSDVVSTLADTDEDTFDSFDSIGVVSTVEEVAAAIDVTRGVVDSKHSLHDLGQ